MPPPMNQGMPPVMGGQPNQGMPPMPATGQPPMPNGGMPARASSWGGPATANPPQPPPPTGPGGQMRRASSSVGRRVYAAQPETQNLANPPGGPSQPTGVPGMPPPAVGMCAACTVVYARYVCQVGKVMAVTCLTASAPYVALTYCWVPRFAKCKPLRLVLCYWRVSSNASCLLSALVLPNIRTSLFVGGAQPTQHNAPGVANTPQVGNHPVISVV